MLWISIALVAALLVAVAVEFRGVRKSPHHSVVSGAARELVESFGEFAEPTGRPVLPWTTGLVGGHFADLNDVPVANVSHPTNHEAAKTAAAAATLSLGEGALDFWHVDSSVLQAYSQLSGREISNGLDLHTLISDRDYKVDTAGFEIKVRGHVGEQSVYDQIRQWNQDGLSVPLSSNNVADDGNLDGHAFNIKVGADSSTLAEHLRMHPDIPVIVNEDMANLPSDAVHVDLTKPFDTDLLADHSVVVADGLLLSDIQDSLADAHGIDLESFDLSDLGNDMTDGVVPGIGTALLVVRSGIREIGLISEHGQRARAVKNVATDAAIVGSGVAGGSAAGTALGMFIDVATLGATGGTGTLIIGPAIGAFAGGFFSRRKAVQIRTKPVTSARRDASEALRIYNGTVGSALERAHIQWEQQQSTSALRMRELESELTTRLSVVQRRAELDLANCELELDRESERLLVDARQVSTSLSFLGLLRARRWNTAADDAHTVIDRLDVLLANEVTATEAGAVARRFAVRRLAVLGASVEAMRRLILVADLGRRLEANSLSRTQSDLVTKTRLTVQPDLERLWMSTDRVRFELIATGHRTRKWVSENLPDVPRPDSII